MERNALEELRAHLLDTNEEFRHLSTQHSEYAHQLDALESQSHLTDEEQLALPGVGRAQHQGAKNATPTHRVVHRAGDGRIGLCAIANATSDTNERSRLDNN